MTASLLSFKKNDDGESDIKIPWLVNLSISVLCRTSHLYHAAGADGNHLPLSVLTLLDPYQIVYEENHLVPAK